MKMTEKRLEKKDNHQKIKKKREDVCDFSQRRG
jgi:hypothetical protein